jgi:hypothetical protein
MKNLFHAVIILSKHHHHYTFIGKEYKWTQWDRIDISDPLMTLSGLLEMIETEYSIEPSYPCCHR